MNVLIKRFAKEQSIELDVETNFHYSEHEDEVIQAISVDEGLEKALSLLGATMSPSVKELIEKISQLQGEEPFEGNVELKTNENVYEVVVFMGILNKMLTLWMDTNEIKAKQLS